VLEEQSENELRLAELLKEERVLSARRQLKLDQRKEDLKLERKRQLAVMNIEKRLVESDIQSFSDAITRMQQLRGNFRRTVPDSVTESAENPRELRARLSDVRRDVAVLDEKCRILQDFVAVGSPSRYSEIMNNGRGLRNKLFAFSKPSRIEWSIVCDGTVVDFRGQCHPDPRALCCDLLLDSPWLYP
jgi:hypothetical protein